jgi:hypothetical protein
MDLQTIISAGTGIGAIIAGSIIVLYGHIKSNIKKRKRDPLYCLNDDILIQDALTELRVKLGADRVYITRFHNGGEYFDGTAIKKISRTHESCKRGCSHELLGFQNVPTSLVTEIISMLEESNRTNNVSFKKVEQIESGFLKNHLINVEARFIIKYRLKVRMNLFGYLGVQYSKEDVNITDDIKNDIIKTAGIIENIFISKK